MAQSTQPENGLFDALQTESNSVLRFPSTLLPSLNALDRTLGRLSAGSGPKNVPVIPGGGGSAAITAQHQADSSSPHDGGGPVANTGINAGSGTENAGYGTGRDAVLRLCHVEQRMEILLKQFEKKLEERFNLIGGSSATATEPSGKKRRKRDKHASIRSRLAQVREDRDIKLYLSFLSSEDTTTDNFYGFQYTCILTSFINWYSPAARWFRAGTLTKLQEWFPFAKDISPLAIIFFSQQPCVNANDNQGPVARRNSAIMRMWYMKRVESCRLRSVSCTRPIPEPGWLASFGTGQKLADVINADFDMLECKIKASKRIKVVGSMAGRREMEEGLESYREESAIHRLKVISSSLSSFRTINNEHRTAVRAELYRHLWFFVDYKKDVLSGHTSLPLSLRCEFGVLFPAMPSGDGFGENGAFDVPSTVRAGYVAETDDGERNARPGERERDRIVEVDSRNESLFVATRAAQKWLKVDLTYYVRVRMEECGEDVDEIYMGDGRTLFHKEKKSVHLYDIADAILTLMRGEATRAAYMRSNRQALRVVHVLAVSLRAVLKYTEGATMAPWETGLMRFITPFVPEESEEAHSLMYGLQHRGREANVASGSNRASASGCGGEGELGDASNSGRRRSATGTSSTANSGAHWPSPIADYYVMRKNKREISYTDYLKRRQKYLVPAGVARADTVPVSRAGQRDEAREETVRVSLPSSTDIDAFLDDGGPEGDAENQEPA